MNVGIIGSGGREHAICYMLSKSKKVSKIFCFPGNAGTSSIAQNVNLDPDNFLELEKNCIEKKLPSRPQQTKLSLTTFAV